MIWQTEDLYFASFVVASGHALKSLEGVAVRKKIFTFDMSKDEIDTMTKSWFYGGLVHAQRYASEIKTLKSMVMTANT